MDSIHGFAQQFQPPSTEQFPRPLLTNLVVWPDQPRLTEFERRQLKETLSVQEAGLPPTLSGHTNDRDSARYAYLRSRALTHLRHQLTELSNARICLGGKLSGYSGRYPGIVEEAYLAIRAGQPAFMSAILGGAASQIIRALTKSNSPKDLCPEVPVAKFYRDRPVDEPLPENPDDLQCNAEHVWRTFTSVGVAGLSAKNKLSVEENQQLFNTQSIDEAIRLILIGLGRLHKNTEWTQ
jgi:hypothetical protein